VLVGFLTTIMHDKYSDALQDNNMYNNMMQENACIPFSEMLDKIVGKEMCYKVILPDFLLSNDSS
jgi:hypothetical protein